MALSACGNGGTTTSDANTTANTNSAANTQATEGGTAETTTSAVADETTTTTETEPAAPEYPIEVQLDSGILFIEGLENGDSSVHLIVPEKNVLVDKFGNIKKSTTPENDDIYNFFWINDNIGYGGKPVVYGAAIRLLDSDGKDITDKYITDENYEIRIVNSTGILISDKEKTTYGVMDLEGNWISEPGTDNDLNRKLEETLSLYLHYDFEFVGEYIIGRRDDYTASVFDMSGNNLFDLIDVTIPSYNHSWTAPGSLYIPTRYDDDNNAVITRIDTATGEQTEIRVPGGFVQGTSGTTRLLLNGDVYEYYDVNMNKLLSLPSENISAILCFENGYYVLYESDPDFTMYNYDGEPMLIFKSLRY